MAALKLLLSQAGRYSFAKHASLSHSPFSFTSHWSLCSSNKSNSNPPATPSQPIQSVSYPIKTKSPLPEPSSESWLPPHRAASPPPAIGQAASVDTRGHPIREGRAVNWGGVVRPARGASPRWQGGGRGSGDSEEEDWGGEWAEDKNGEGLRRGADESVIFASD